MAPFILFALTCVGIALILATIGLVRRSNDAGWAANWFGLAAMLPLTLLLGIEFGDEYGPSFLGWCHLVLFALAILSILLGTLALSAGTTRKRRWRNTVVVLSLLWLFVAAFFVAQYIRGTRREREFHRAVLCNPNMSERADWPVKKAKLQDAGPDAELAHHTPSERIVLVWQATLQGWALSSGRSDEPAFRRDVARVIRGQAGKI